MIYDEAKMHEYLMGLAGAKSSLTLHAVRTFDNLWSCGDRLMCLFLFSSGLVYYRSLSNHRKA